MKEFDKVSFGNTEFVKDKICNSQKFTNPLATDSIIPSSLLLHFRFKSMTGIELQAYQ